LGAVLLLCQMSRRYCVCCLIGLDSEQLYVAVVYDKWIHLVKSSPNANILSVTMTFSLVLGCHWGQNRGPWSLQLKFSLTSLHSVLSNQPAFTSTSRSLHHRWLFVYWFLEHETSEVSTRAVFTAGDCYVLATAVGPQWQL